MRKYRIENRKRILSLQRLYYKRNKKRIACYLKRIGIGKKNNTCEIGRKYELIALALLKGSKDMNYDCFQGGYDLEWRDKKIEVKVRQTTVSSGWGFSFKPTCTADHALLFCIRDGLVEKIILTKYSGEKCIRVTSTSHGEDEIMFLKQETIKTKKKGD